MQSVFVYSESLSRHDKVHTFFLLIFFAFQSHGDGPI